MYAAQPARLILRVDDQIGNKGSMLALRTISSKLSSAMPPLTVWKDNAYRTETSHRDAAANLQLSLTQVLTLGSHHSPL